MASVSTAFKVTAGVLAVVGSVSTTLFAKEHLTLASFLLLLGGAILSWPLTFLLLELERRGQHEHALRRVLDAEKTYEALLFDARKERDDAVAERTVLQASNLLVSSMFPPRQLAEGDGDTEQEEEPKPRPKQKARRSS